MGAISRRAESGERGAGSGERGAGSEVGFVALAGEGEEAGGQEQFKGRLSLDQESLFEKGSINREGDDAEGRYGPK